MTTLQIFAFFGVPVITVVLGIVVYIVEAGRFGRRDREPDLFDKKSLRTPGE